LEFEKATSDPVAARQYLEKSVERGKLDLRLKEEELTFRNRQSAKIYKWVAHYSETVDAQFRRGQLVSIAQSPVNPIALRKLARTLVAWKESQISSENWLPLIDPRHFAPGLATTSEGNVGFDVVAQRLNWAADVVETARAVVAGTRSHDFDAALSAAQKLESRFAFEPIDLARKLQSNGGLYSSFATERGFSPLLALPPEILSLTRPIRRVDSSDPEPDVPQQTFSPEPERHATRYVIAAAQDFFSAPDQLLLRITGIDKAFRTHITYITGYQLRQIASAGDLEKGSLTTKQLSGLFDPATEIETVELDAVTDTRITLENYSFIVHRKPLNPKRIYTASEDETATDQELADVSLGELSDSDFGVVFLTYEGNKASQIVRLRNDAGKINTISWIIGRELIRYYSPDLFQSFIGRAQVVVRGSEPPPRGWDPASAALPGGSERQIVVQRSGRSPKSQQEEFDAAIRMLRSPVDLASIKVFNALPKTLSEVRRAGVRGSVADWASVNQQIATALSAASISSQRATKDSLIQELTEGDSNLLVLFAHNPGQGIALSNGRGDMLSVSELRGIRRHAAPQRAVLLVVCGSGSVDKQDASIAEVLLQNKLATAVLASSEALDARRMPDAIRRFAGTRQLLEFVPFNLNPIVEQQFEPLAGERFSAVAGQ
jgi:hypothetical protein